MSGYWKRVEERQRPDTSPYRAGFAQTICVAETDEEAERLYSQHAALLLQSLPACFPGLRRRARLPHDQDHPDRRAEPVRARAEYPKLTWKDLVEGGHVIAGCPETVRQRFEDLIKGLRVGNIFLLLHVGNMPKEKCMYSTKLFADKVMPHLRNMWPEHADDGRFWCQPLPRLAEPAPIGRGAMVPAQ